MWKRRPAAKKSGPALVLVEQGDITVIGHRSALMAAIEPLLGLGARARRIVDVPAVLAAASGRPDATELIRLSPASLDLLRAHGAVPGAEGFFRMFVQDRTGPIAGQLQWEKANVGVEQALTLKTAAVTLALRAALAEVEASVRRIEGKLDQVTRLLRAQRKGDALGDYRTLTQLAQRVRNSGKISVADWTTVASMGPEIGRDLEGLRSHILALLRRERPGTTAWSRAEEVQTVLDEEWLEETLALLAIVEQNFNLWQEIRIAHIRQDEPRYLTDTVADARDQLQEQRHADQLLLDRLVEFATVVADPRLLDGLDPINSRRLGIARDHLDEMVRWFADQRLLDATPLATEPFPGFLQSARHLVSAVGSVAGKGASKAKTLVFRRQVDRAALTEQQSPKGIDQGGTAEPD